MKKLRLAVCIASLAVLMACSDSERAENVVSENAGSDDLQQTPEPTSDLAPASEPLPADAVITIDPSSLLQSVKFGADIKLTLKHVAETNAEGVIDRFLELGMDMIRVPIYATRAINDPFYDRVYQVSDIAEDKGMAIFASVANGDGDQNNNLHNKEKFAPSLMCDCPNSIYNLDLSAYSTYLSSYINNMEANDAAVSILGPFNEDNASSSDYRNIWEQMTRNEFQRIGVESWSLEKAPERFTAVSDQIDIVGSHFYDDDQFERSVHEDYWAQFVTPTDAIPAWFTEATRLNVKGNGQVQSIISGIEHIIPAIRGGVERVFIYQTANRLVWYNGGKVEFKFNGFKQFLTKASGSVVESTIDDSELMTVSFKDGDMLSINITNPSDTEKTVRIDVPITYNIEGEVTRTMWVAAPTEADEDIDGAIDMVTVEATTQWVATVPAQSYVHLAVPISEL